MGIITNIMLLGLSYHYGLGYLNRHQKSSLNPKGDWLEVSSASLFPMPAKHSAPMVLELASSKHWRTGLTLTINRDPSPMCANPHVSKNLKVQSKVFRAR